MRMPRAVCHAWFLLLTKLPLLKSLLINIKYSSSHDECEAGAGGKATVPTSKRVHFEGGNLAGSALASASAHSKSSLSIRKRRRRRGRESSRGKSEDDELEKRDGPRATFGFGRERDCSINEIGWRREGGGGAAVSLAQPRGRGEAAGIDWQGRSKCQKRFLICATLGSSNNKTGNK